MPFPHIVKQGEHLSGIADQYGFSDYKPIWNHSANAALKALRKNPNVLYPGDQLQIPDGDEKHYTRGVDQRHRFVVHGTPLKLQLKLEELYGKLLADVPYRLQAEEQSATGHTDGQGMVRHGIGKQLKKGTLVISEQVTAHGQNLTLDRELPLMVGHLDPIEKPSGQLARLANLGYYWGSLTASDADSFESAIEEFQCEQGLPVTGECDSATQAKLQEMHGC